MNETNELAEASTFHGANAQQPITEQNSWPRKMLIHFGNSVARSLALETLLAVMFVVMEPSAQALQRCTVSSDTLVSSNRSSGPPCEENQPSGGARPGTRTHAEQKKAAARPPCDSSQPPFSMTSNGWNVATPPKRGITVVICAEMAPKRAVMVKRPGTAMSWTTADDSFLL